MRRIVMTLTLLALLPLLAASHADAQTTLKMAFVAPPPVWGPIADRYAQTVAQKTGDQVKIQSFGGGQLGSLPQNYAGFKTGQIDMMLADCGSLSLAKGGKDFNILFAPYAFRDQAHFRAFMRSRLFKEMIEKVEAEAAFKYVGYVSDRAARQLSTSKTRVAKPEDMKGLKIRVPETVTIMHTFRAWGAAPTPVAASELYLAMKQGLVDGQVLRGAEVRDEDRLRPERAHGAHRGRPLEPAHAGPADGARGGGRRDGGVGEQDDQRRCSAVDRVPQEAGHGDRRAGPRPVQEARRRGAGEVRRRPLVEGARGEDPGRQVRLLDRAVEVLIGVLLVALVVTAFGQVVARYVFGRPFTWVLETDIFLMIWATFLSGYVGVRRDSHLRVDYVLERMTRRQRRRATLTARFLSLAFVVVLGVKSFEVIRAMDGIDFTSIPLGMDVLYWSLPVGSGLMALALIERLLREWRAPGA
jgi:TRAP-type C4-dicarboxylate transport system permease small subunit